MSPTTLGIDHLGLTVRELDQTVAFFTQCLGWKEVGGKPDYPSKFISDGTSVLTLWRPKVHFFIAEPGGLRLEFAYDPR